MCHKVLARPTSDLLHLLAEAGLRGPALPSLHHIRSDWGIVEPAVLGSHGLSTSAVRLPEPLTQAPRPLCWRTWPWSDSWARHLPPAAHTFCVPSVVWKSHPLHFRSELGWGLTPWHPFSEAIFFWVGLLVFPKDNPPRQSQTPKTDKGNRGSPLCVASAG